MVAEVTEFCRALGKEPVLIVGPTGVGKTLAYLVPSIVYAKESGRNRVHSFEENDLDLMRRRREMQWAARINNALEESRFELFRMTILPLQQEDAGEHFELLLRMRDESGKIVAPDQFIAAAERYGITPRIDRWVVETAFRWLVSEADERERLALCSINLSGQSLGDDKFLPFVIDQFHRSGIDASKICFEITETAAIASFAQANRFIQALKELGCRFALDDFGADDAIGARTIVDHYRLTDLLGEFLSRRARQHIAGAARRERHDDAQRAHVAKDTHDFWMRHLLGVKLRRAAAPYA